jgi:hypothetical protein
MFHRSLSQSPIVLFSTSLWRQAGELQDRRDDAEHEEYGLVSDLSHGVGATADMLCGLNHLCQGSAITGWPCQACPPSPLHLAVAHVLR